MRTLKVLRLVFGIPFHRLAKEAEISERELHRIEAGEIQPMRGTLERLDGALLRLIAERVKPLT